MRLNWTTPPAATLVHATLAAAEELPFVDASLASKLVVDGVDRERLVAIAGEVATGGDPPAEVAAGLQALGESMEELAYRVRPLREQWDARGPGLLHALAKLTEPPNVEDATVALVLPVVGGHGVALPGHSAVLFEAVLANPHSQLPEVVRLAWLLAQLAPEANRLALAPAVLAAAEDVELAAADEATLAEALAAWHAVSTPDEAADRAAALWSWWEAYRADCVDWRSAQAAAPVWP